MLILVIAVVGVLMLPADRIAGIAAEQIARATGRQVSITGDVQMSFWPVLGVSAGGLEVGNAPWAGEGAMLSSGATAIGVDAAALLRGDIRITQVRATGPVIRLEARADGRANWTFADGDGGARVESTASPSTRPRSLTIERLEVTDATLIYDAEGSDRVRLSGVDLTLNWPDPAGEAQIAAVLRPAGQPVRLDVTIGGFADFLQGEVRPTALIAKAPGGEVAMQGRAALDGALAGQLRLDMTETRAFLAALGAPGVDLPAGLGRSASLRGDLTLTPDRRLALRDMQADLGGNSLRGAVDVDLSGKPRITAQLKAGALDLRALTGGSESAAGGSAGGWPKDPIDASALALFDGSIALEATSVDLGAMKLGTTRAQLRNDRARMVFDLQEVRGYGGLLAGEFVMNNRNGLSVGGSLRGRDVGLKPLLTDLAGIDRFTGATNVELNFLGVGQSVDAILRSLSGAASVSLGRGTIEGIDLDDLLGSFDVQGGTTVFDSARASFVIENGVARGDDLIMLLPNVEARGAGQIDLGGQRLDYTFTPKALRVNGDRGLSVPVRIFGPWADPAIKPDLQAAIDLNFAEEKKEAEQRVKQKVDEKLAEELGVVRQEGQSVEEAVKDRVEDKLKEELFRLFD